MSTFKVPEDSTRFNFYIKNEIADKFNKYCEDNFLSKSAACTLIFRNFFDGQEAMKSMGNLAEMMNVLAKQTGIDLTAGQVSSPERG